MTDIKQAQAATLAWINSLTFSEKDKVHILDGLAEYRICGTDICRFAEVLEYAKAYIEREQGFDKPIEGQCFEAPDGDKFWYIGNVFNTDFVLKQVGRRDKQVRSYAFNYKTTKRLPEYDCSAAPTNNEGGE
jgi:hypothetical protein